MGITLDQAGIARVLEGPWSIGASNIGPWVDGSRREPRLRFTVSESEPLVLVEEQKFIAGDGKERTITITNRFAHGRFTSKSRMLGPMSRWMLGGSDAASTVVVIRMTHERGGQDGLLVLVREDAQRIELRANVATNFEQFELGPEDFASLTWLPMPE